VLGELYHWREKVASKRNIPRFKVLTDEKMVQIVQSNPESMRDLNDMRLLTRHTAQQYGLSILRALANGRKAPLPTKPRPIHIDNTIVERHEKLKAWRKKRALDRGVESDVIVRREALWALAKANPNTPEELIALNILGPWRLAKYGEEILQTLNTKKKK
jgi:ribonuclease D